jgi:hypothetical protein
MPGSQPVLEACGGVALLRSLADNPLILSFALHRHDHHNGF